VNCFTFVGSEPERSERSVAVEAKPLTKCKLLQKENSVIKTIIILTLFSLSQLWAQDAYERHCVECHKELPTTLQQMFKKYLQLYSGEENVKAGLKHYLRYPSKSISVMSELFIDNYGIKKKSKLSDEELNKAIDIYWEKFKVFDKLK